MVYEGSCGQAWGFQPTIFVKNATAAFVSVVMSSCHTKWPRVAASAIWEPPEVGKGREIIRLTSHMHRGSELPVEFGEPLRAQPLDFAQRNRRVAEQASNVDTLTLWREGRQITRPPGEHVHRAVVIQTAKVMEGDADLQNALI